MLVAIFTGCSPTSVVILNEVDLKQFSHCGLKVEDLDANWQGYLANGMILNSKTYFE